MTDAAGNLVARCRQRGRFAQAPPRTGSTGSAHLTPETGAQDADLLTMIGAVTSSAEDGDDLELTSTPSLANPMGNLHGGVTLCDWHIAVAVASHNELLTGFMLALSRSI